MVHIGHAALRRIVRHPFRRADPADPPAINLDETDSAVVDQVARHVRVVSTLATRQLYLVAALCQRSVCLVGSGLKRLLQPDGA